MSEKNYENWTEWSDLTEDERIEHLKRDLVYHLMSGSIKVHSYLIRNSQGIAVILYDNDQIEGSYNDLTDDDLYDIIKRVRKMRAECNSDAVEEKDNEL